MVKSALKRLGDRRQAAEAARGAGPDLLGEEPHDRSAGVLPGLDQPDGREDRAHLRDLPGGAVQGECAGLRRSAAGDGAAAEDRRARCASATTGATVPADRRVPGHEPAAV